MINAIRNFMRHNPVRRGLLVEAVLALLLARLALRVFPFRQLTPMFNRPARAPQTTGEQRERQRNQVVWAIRRASRNLPGKTVCFPRGIAAQAMLRRRGISTTLYYGFTRLPDGKPAAHVWVQDGEQGVIGHRHAGVYSVLAKYPDRLEPPGIHQSA